MSEQLKLLTFYSLLVSQTLSLIGSRMTGLALSVWIFKDTGEATPLILVSFFAFLPRLLSASLAGLLADRWNRRYVMMLADAGQALGTVLLLISFASGSFQVWHLYTVTVIQSVFDIFQMPAFQSTVTMLIPDRHRNRANAIQLITSPLSGVIAPAITGAVYAGIGVVGIIVVDLLSFLLSIVVLFLFQIPQPPVTQNAPLTRQSIWRESMAGFQFVWERKPLLLIFVFTGSTNFFYAGVLALNTPYILSRTNSETMLGILLGAFSLGSVAGTVLMAVWGGAKRRVHTMMPVIAMNGFLLMLYGTQTDPLIMAVLLFFTAMGSPINNLSIISTLQIKVPLALQGRVFAAISQISMTLIPLSYILIGPLADNVFEPYAQSSNWSVFVPLFGSGAGAGMALLMTLCGIAIFVISLGIYTIPMVRNLETLLPDYVSENASTRIVEEIAPEAV